VTPAVDWDAAAADLRARTGCRVLRHEPLARHTTMRVGGPADLLVTARDIPALVALVGWARAAGIPHLVLGRGSNVVVADPGIHGLVILCRAEGHRIEGCRLLAEAGLALARAAVLAQQAGLSGLEFGIAIPGSVGGAVWANAGAHGADVAAVLESVLVLGPDGSATAEPAARLGLAYRDSRLKHAAEPAAELVLSATFALRHEDPVMIKARLDEIRRWRRANQPIGLASAGSVFRNPADDSAGRLIDACGLKGRRVGGATISTRHANFVVNDRQATAADVRSLAELARAEVARRFGVELAYEVQYLGDWSNWHEEES
jgi:UDP-N-acetylmuramate dehydrogenase